LKDENWDRFLPNYKKKIAGNKAGKKKAIKEKKEYTPWAPEPTKRKEDYLLETGEYFLTKDEKEGRAKVKKKSDGEARVKDKKAEKAKKFEAPGVEDEIARDQQRKDKIMGKRAPELALTDQQEVKALKKKFKIDSGKFGL
jgi:ribosomal RNA assembly protein